MAKLYFKYGVMGSSKTAEALMCRFNYVQKGFNVSANFSNCTNLSAESLIGMLESLKDLRGETAKSLTIGATNLAKLTNAQKGIATDKNWTLS